VSWTLLLPGNSYLPTHEPFGQAPGPLSGPRSRANHGDRRPLDPRMVV